MNGTADVCLALTVGPICGLGDARIEAAYPLWDSIIATESFPPGAGASGANYVLRLKKEVVLQARCGRPKTDLRKRCKCLPQLGPSLVGHIC